jgi:hypothetical protein
MGNACGRRLGHRSLGAAGGRGVVGARVGSGGGRAGRGGTDLSQVRERERGRAQHFFDKTVTSVDYLQSRRKLR